MNNEKNITNTLQSWIHQAPTYWIIGGCLVFTAYKIGIIQTITTKFTKKEEDKSKTAKKTSTTN